MNIRRKKNRDKLKIKIHKVFLKKNNDTQNKIPQKTNFGCF